MWSKLWQNDFGFLPEMIYHWGGEPEWAMHCWLVMDNSKMYHCLLFHKHGKKNFVQPFLRSRIETTTATHMLGLNFTMKSWVESMALMSVIMHGPYLEQTQLRCIIWRYHLWTAYPCLSWSAVAMCALTWVVFAPGFFHTNAALWQVAQPQ